MLGFFRKSSKPTLPQAGLLQRLEQISGLQWLDSRGQAQAGRVMLPGRCLAVVANSTIDLIDETVDGVLLVATVTGTGLTMVEDVDYSIEGRVVTFINAGTVYDVISLSGDVPVDHYPLCEGTGAVIYSVTRQVTPANLDGCTWAHQSLYPSWCNQRGYYLSSGVYIPILGDGTKFADGSAIGTFGSYAGRGIFPAKMRDGACLSIPARATATCTITTDATPNIGTTGFTMSYWRKSLSSGARMLISLLGDSTHKIQSYDFSTTTRVVVFNGSTNGEVYFSRPSANVWHYVVIRYDGTQVDPDDRVTVYIDGEAVATTVVSTIPDTLPTISSAKLVIGNDSTSTDTLSIYAYQLYNAALPPSDIAGLYAGTLLTTAPQLLYTFGTLGSDRTWDLSAQANHGTLAGAGWTDGIRWGTTQDICFYGLYSGYSVYGNSTPSYFVVPYGLTGSPLTITPPSGYSKIADFPAGGFNGNVYLSVATMQMDQDYDGTNLPAEMTPLARLVELRGAGYPYGDYRDVTVTFAELVSMATSADSAIIRRGAGRLRKADAVATSIVKFACYEQTQDASTWTRILKYLRLA